MADTLRDVIEKGLDQIASCSFTVEHHGLCVVVRHSDALHALLAVRAALSAPAGEQKPTAHTLTLEFGRFLSQEEWREVAAKAWTVPHVQRIRGDAVAEAIEKDTP